MTINRKTNTQDKMFTAKTKEELETLYKELQSKGWELDDEPRSQGQFNGGFGRFYMCLHRSVPEDFQDPCDPYEIPLVDDDDDEEDERDDIAECPVCGKITDLTRDQFCKHLKFYLFDGEIQRSINADDKLDKWLDKHPLFDEEYFELNEKNVEKCVKKFNLYQETISGSGISCGPVYWEMKLFYGEEHEDE